MRGAESLAPASLGLALAIAVVALGLGLRLEWERRNRDTDLSGPDRRHFRRQELRRWLGVGLLTLLAIGVYVGSRVPELIPIEPAPADVGPRVRPNPLFLVVWLGVFATLLGAVVLALFDWSATREYARRHRREIDRRRAEFLREALGRHELDESGGSNGRPVDHS